MALELGRSPAPLEAEARRLKLAVVSAKFPFGTKESYLGTELSVLGAHLGEVVLLPASPDLRAAKRSVAATTIALPLAAGATLRRAVREALRDVRRSLRVVCAVMFDRTPLRVKAKNVVVLPKAFALAGIVRDLGIEHVHAYWLSTPATIAFAIGELTGISWSATAHRWDIYENNMVRTKLERATFVRAISERGRRDLLRQAPSAAAHVTTVRVGVALPLAPAFSVPGECGKLRLVCAANLVPVKGHRFVLEALAAVRARGIDAHLTLAGDGPLRASLAARVAELGLDCAVAMPGNLPHERMLEDLRGGKYDAAVLASIEASGGLMEGVPVALIEAMACGVPCIGSNSGSIGELLQPGCGLLVPHSNAAALADAFELFARDPALRAAFGARARAHVEAQYDIRTTAGQLATMLAPGA